MKKTKVKKIITVVGPTASGKSELAVKIARRFNGEIISADSRQVYKGMDIGTGKIKGEWKKILRSLPIRKLSLRGVATTKQSIPELRLPRSRWSLAMTKKELLNNLTSKAFVYKSIPHHCINIVSPKKVFTVADFKKCAEMAIKDIHQRGKIPILCGGTGFYVDSVLYNLPIPNVPPNAKLRAQLSKKSATELFRMLKKLDPKRAGIIDRHNPRRLIRAIEIIKATKKPIRLYGNVIARERNDRSNLENGLPKGLLRSFQSLAMTKRRISKDLDILIIGIKIPKEKLYKRIDQRLEQRLKQGMIREVKNLIKNGVSHKRLQSLGLEYRFISLYLQKKLSRKEMKEKLKNTIHQYAKRQMTWFKRNKDIHWINLEYHAYKLVEDFIKSSRHVKMTNFKAQMSNQAQSSKLKNFGFWN